MDIDWLICCLCGEVIEDYMESHNPEPLCESVNDRCCNLCNDFVVIPARMEQMLSANKEAIDSASKR